MKSGGSERGNLVFYPGYANLFQRPLNTPQLAGGMKAVRRKANDWLLNPKIIDIKTAWG
jgi:hypothetical protein